jgi:hypothetical protein
MPMMVEPLVFQPNAVAGGYMVDGDLTKIVHLVRQAVELGADVIKADPTDDVSRSSQGHRTASGIPVLVRGGGRVSDKEILVRTEGLLQQGAAGIVYRPQRHPAPEPAWHHAGANGDGAPKRLGRRSPETHLSPVSSPAPALLARLREIVGVAQVLASPEDTIPYGFDGTAALEGRSGSSCCQDRLEEVSAVVKLANEHGVTIVTRGSGTDLSGGSVPSEGCLVLCLTRLDKVLSVDAANLTVRAQCGAITAAIDAAANRHGLFYPPDPGSMKISTIGGNVAENSGGLRGLKYGVTRDYVHGPRGRAARRTHRPFRQRLRGRRRRLFDEGPFHRLAKARSASSPKSCSRSCPVPPPAARCSRATSRMEDAAQTVSD